MSTSPLLCDGCGQPGSPEHLARRLQRLEWATRYRPVHIGTLLLGAVSPEAGEFLYAGQFAGEAERVLSVTQIDAAGKPAEAVLSEFQKRGYFLTHLLECPLDEERNGGKSLEELLAARVGAAIVRIRRSLRPKRVALISRHLAPLLGRLSSAKLGCQVMLDGNKPFSLDAAEQSEGAVRLREALAGATAR